MLQLFHNRNLTSQTNCINISFHLLSIEIVKCEFEIFKKFKKIIPVVSKPIQNHLVCVCNDTQSHNHLYRVLLQFRRNRAWNLRNSKNVSVLFAQMTLKCTFGKVANQRRWRLNARIRFRHSRRRIVRPVRINFSKKKSKIKKLFVVNVHVRRSAASSTMFGVFFQMFFGCGTRTGRRVNHVSVSFVTKKRF